MGLGGFGHIFDAISRMKQNAKLKTSARRKFKSYMDKRTMEFDGEKDEFPAFTPEQIASEKERIRLWARKKRIRYAIGWVTSVLVSIIVFYWLFEKVGLI